MCNKEGARGFSSPASRRTEPGNRKRGASAMPAIAVIDDDAAVCDSTRFLLETHGLEVYTYESGRDFLKEAHKVDCVVVDYQMPGLTGLECVEELRKRGCVVPSIMITATTDLAVERRAAELGISKVLKKPLSNRELLAAIFAELN
jgi:two-component system, LuxR family, response regulator FixJ